jgi:hypothetical protein
VVSFESGPITATTAAPNFTFSSAGPHPLPASRACWNAVADFDVTGRPTSRAHREQPHRRLSSPRAGDGHDRWDPTLPLTRPHVGDEHRTSTARRCRTSAGVRGSGLALRGVPFHHSPGADLPCRSRATSLASATRRASATWRGSCSTRRRAGSRALPHSTFIRGRRVPSPGPGTPSPAGSCSSGPAEPGVQPRACCGSRSPRSGSVRSRCRRGPGVIRPARRTVSPRAPNSAVGRGRRAGCAQRRASTSTARFRRSVRVERQVLSRKDGPPSGRSAPHQAPLQTIGNRS